MKKEIKASAGGPADGWSGVPLYMGKVAKQERRTGCPSYLWPSLAEEIYTFDSDVATAWRSLKNTLLSANFEWTPGPAAEGEDPVLAEITIELARSMNDNMGLGNFSGRMERSFEAIMAQILLYILVGFRYMEICWKYNDALDRYDIVDLKDRKPSAHDEWVTWPVDKEGIRLPEAMNDGKLRGVLQKPALGDAVGESKQGQRPFIPAESLLLFTHDQEGDDYNGVGLLRSLEAVYHRKNKAFLKIDHFLDSRSVPILEIDDAGAAEEEGGACSPVKIQDQLAAARAGALDFHKGNAAFLESYSRVKIVDTLMLEHNPEKAQAILDAARHEILSVFFVQFLMLGVTDSGSRSVGEVHESFFRRASINILDYVCSIFNGDWAAGKGLAGAYAYMNADQELPTDALPKLKHKNLEVDPALEQFANILAAQDKGLIGPVTREDQQHLRNVLGLPQLQVEENKDAISAEESA